MKQIIPFYACAALMLCGSCSEFMDTYPLDALSPATTWKTEADADKFLTGCYDGWLWGEEYGALECASDFGFAQHGDETYWRAIGNGTVDASYGSRLYSFTRIRRCITFLENIDKVAADESVKKDMIAQARVIRAYDYFKMNFWFGGVPIIKSFKDGEEAKVPRNTEAEVKKYIYDELDAAIPDLKEERFANGGRIRKGAGLALKMRSALYWGDYQRALDAAKAIVALGQYELDNDYANVFSIAGRDSKEIILSVQHLLPNKGEWSITIATDPDGGWSSMLPTMNLVDTYEMSNGLTKDETGSGYDPAHPFADRDPRMAATVLFPGKDWRSGYNNIFNTLDEKLPNGEDNRNYKLTTGSNAAVTGVAWAKYVDPQHLDDAWNTEQQQIIFRYAEVLLTIAEAGNELSGPSAEVYDALDAVRERVDMPVVDRAKYSTKEKLRELIRRERAVELAGEGLRRADILRWGIAETVLNDDLTRVTGTVDYNGADQYTRATVTGTSKIETRTFAAKNRYLPIPQSSIDKNPQLKQNDGY